MSFYRKLPNKAVIVLIYMYRIVFSPTVGILRFLPFYPKPSCVFYPTCSQYAVSVFTKYSFIVGLKKTISRLSRCHPHTEPSIDLP